MPCRAVTVISAQEMTDVGVAFVKGHLSRVGHVKAAMVVVVKSSQDFVSSTEHVAQMETKEQENRVR